MSTCSCAILPRDGMMKRVALVSSVVAALCAVMRNLHDWAALVADVEMHVEEVHGQLQLMFTDLCKPDPPVFIMPPDEQKVGDIHVPSCAALQERFGAYYGNLNMLLVEAWIHKILPTLRQLASTWVWLPVLPHVVLRAESTSASSVGMMTAGAIFVMQLSWRSSWMPSDAAMMIGIHRMPRHKQWVHSVRPKPPPVTEELIGLVKRWSAERRLRRLFVCPYEELINRLASQGFTSSPLAIGASLAFGHLPLADVCEDGRLMMLTLD